MSTSLQTLSCFFWIALELLQTPTENNLPFRPQVEKQTQLPYKLLLTNCLFGLLCNREHLVLFREGEIVRLPLLRSAASLFEDNEIYHASLTVAEVAGHEKILHGVSSTLGLRLDMLQSGHSSTNTTARLFLNSGDWKRAFNSTIAAFALLLVE